MKAITKASRVNTALQVIQHMNDGMSVVDACQMVGMPRSSFYYFIENNPEAVAEIQAIIDANNREQLGLILLSKTEILKKVIEAGLADGTKPKDRLAIFMKLDDLVDDLTKNLQIESEAAKQAHEFLKLGPITSHKVSRLTAFQTSVTIESEA
jgi:hypothetical protein